MMSATLNSSLFSGYFKGAPTLSIPGRTFPVTALFLEDALELTAHKVRPNADWAKKKGRGRVGSLGAGLDGLGGGGRDSDVCFDFTRGRCSHGERCRFSHAPPGAAPPLPGGPPPGGMGGFPPPSGLSAGARGGGGGLSAAAAAAAARTLLADRRLGGAPGSLAASAEDDDNLETGDLTERYPGYLPATLSALAALDSSAVNFELLTQLIQWILAKGRALSAPIFTGASSLGLCEGLFEHSGSPALRLGRHRGGGSACRRPRLRRLRRARRPRRRG